MDVFIGEQRWKHFHPEVLNQLCGIEWSQRKRMYMLQEELIEKALDMSAKTELMFEYVLPTHQKQGLFAGPVDLRHNNWWLLRKWGRFYYLKMYFRDKNDPLYQLVTLRCIAFC